jgi:hypothetical protein
MSRYLTKVGKRAFMICAYYYLGSSAFDAKRGYEKLITTSSLPALLKRENGLLSGKGTSSSDSTAKSNLVSSKKSGT